MTLEKEANKVDYRNLFHEINLKEDNSDRFTGLTTLVADDHENKQLNRYYNVLPYDHTRVKLKYQREDVFINASHVRVPEANRDYILTQGPLEQTVDHFWLMCQQVKTTCIIMLCRCYESDKDKSARYWPTEVEGTLRLNYGLDVELVDETETMNFVVRNFRLTDTETGIFRNIKQLHYINWPDFNVPDCPDAFLDFLETVRETGCFEAGVGPPIVHCSAGIGRSGTFCLVDSCLVLVAKGKELTISIIRNMLLNMRTQRKGLIQTHEQLRFSVSSIIDGMTRLSANGTLEPVKPSSTAGQQSSQQQLHERSTNGKRVSGGSGTSGTNGCIAASVGGGNSRGNNGADATGGGSQDSPPSCKKRKNSDS